MELVEHEITLPNAQTKLFCHLLTDVHYEASGSDRKKFLRDVARIKELNEADNNELHYWIGGGDWANGISAKDKRFDAACVANPFKKYVGNDLHTAVAETLVDVSLPIQPWCWGYGRGNHEDEVIKHCDFDPARIVAKGLNVNYLGYSAAIRLRIKCQAHVYTLLLYWHHGFGASRAKGGKLNMLYSLRDKVSNADVFMTGHVHEPITFPSVRMEVPSTGKLRQKARQIIFVNGGTYQKSYQPDGVQKTGGFNKGHDVLADYSEKRAYDPAVIGHMGWSFEVRRPSKGWSYALKGVDFR